MVDIRSCTVDDILTSSNIDALLEEYSNETLADGYPEHSVSAVSYHRLESTGKFLMIGAFDGDKLVGFITALLSELPHFTQTITVMESFFVTQDYRSTGAGLKLLSGMEARTKDKAYGMLISAPVESVLSKILPRINFKHTAEVFFKKYE